MMNLKINILTKKGFTNLDIFLFVIIFQKITKTILMAVAEVAIDIFFISLMDITVSHRIHLILVCFYFMKILNA